jgi:hypothetical protein
MNNIVILYEIVPVGDGLHYICKNNAGEYYKEHKGYTVKEMLVFDSESTAKKYINKHLDADLYKPEKFGYNIKHLPCEVITGNDM